MLKNSWFGDYAQAVLQVANGGASITPSLAKKILSLVSRSQTYVVPASSLTKEEKLSEREIEILKLIACGYSSPEISTQLQISTMTVSTHVKNMYRKLQAKTRAHAVKAASLRGLI
ncbi:putative transcriptional regulatory protein NarL [bioreactor metagenome]|uniref:Putative transcriptional regulatory protein NarL n=1 Tax=bioreactor metagenome TaxID=1076179 RepID=A0A645J0G7_9ZZZZ